MNRKVYFILTILIELTQNPVASPTPLKAILITQAFTPKRT
jgi:hypothetical protein